MMPWKLRRVDHYSTIIGDVWPVVTTAHCQDGVPNPDAIKYIVHTPGGPVALDPNFWTITGEVLMVTVTPSLDVHPTANAPGWHGFITAGIMGDDLAGRVYAPEEDPNRA